MPRTEIATADPRKEALRAAPTPVVLKSFYAGGRPGNELRAMGIGSMAMIGEIGRRIGQLDQGDLLNLGLFAGDRAKPDRTKSSDERAALLALNRLCHSADSRLDAAGGARGEATSPVSDLDVRVAVDAAKVIALAEGRKTAGPVIREYVPQGDKTARFVQVYSGIDFGGVLGYPTPELNTLRFVREDRNGQRESRRWRLHDPDVVMQVGFDGEVMDDQPPAPRGIQTYASYDGTPYRVERQMVLPAAEGEPLDPLLPRDVVLVAIGADESRLVAERTRQAIAQHTTRNQAA